VPALVLASEQFTALAHTLLRSQASPEALAVVLPGNPSYADQIELEKMADVALEEVVKRLKAYPA